MTPLLADVPYWVTVRGVNAVRAPCRQQMCDSRLLTTMYGITGSFIHLFAVMHVPALLGGGRAACDLTKWGCCFHTLFDRVPCTTHVTGT